MSIVTKENDPKLYNVLFEDEEKQRKKFLELLGESKGYIEKECSNCGRQRVELYSSGKKICEKCGFEQNEKKYYSNKYGTFLEYVLNI